MMEKTKVRFKNSRLTEDEINFIKNNPRLGPKALSNLLGRSRSIIGDKRKELNLPKIKRNHPFTEEQINNIKQYLNQFLHIN